MVTLIKDRLLLLGLVPIIINTNEYTFFQETAGAKSYIDFFCLSYTNSLVNLAVLDDARNMSDHQAINMHFTEDSFTRRGDTLNSSEINASSREERRSRLNWNN